MPNGLGSRYLWLAFNVCLSQAVGDVPPADVTEGRRHPAYDLGGVGYLRLLDGDPRLAGRSQADRHSCLTIPQG